MNKRGAVLFFILFGVAAAVGLFFMLTFDSSSFVQTKGTWPLSFLRATQQTEENLLGIDGIAVQSAREAAEVTISTQLAQDAGCGMYEKIVLWNIPAGFCNLNVEEIFKITLQTKLKQRTNITYDEIVLAEGFLAGKTAQRKTITSSLDVIPTEQRSTGLFSGYDAYLIRPFYLRYEYNPGFRVPLPEKLKAYQTTYEEAKNMVVTCQPDANLLGCLQRSKPATWKFSSCTQELLPTTKELNNRKVLFCSPTERYEIKLALDFG